jgi:hypothetical protein
MRIDRRYLARGRSGGARCARNDDHIAAFDLSDIDQAEIGRHAGDPQDADGDAGGDAVRQHLHRPLGGVGDHVLLPAGHAEQQLAGLIGIGTALDDLADAAAADDFADLDRRQIARHVVHPGADRRIYREVADLDQGLAVLEVGSLLGFHAGRVLINQARGALGQDQSPVLLAHVAIVGR